ncbi:hypothetical protein LSH36_424g01045 [Paralvinella palmiformis]|uniref:Uncharacterized protein n=1 Tax=Paralvinella palmiformis TaxID=53620 RepID=A0AAD9MYF4_9ANNE|nr:hypothetical protein LSH36_424g01045 [Paralvinella palmiformis]
MGFFFPAQGNSGTSAVTMAANHSSITDHLSLIGFSAQLKYDAKAYLHWYEKYGCEQSDFDDAFTVLNDCIQAYTEMVGR